MNLDTVMEFFGVYSQPYTLEGKYIHARAFNNDQEVPLADQKVSVYVKRFFSEIHVGDFTTDRDGNFTFSYSPPLFTFGNTHDLVLKVMEETLPERGDRKAEHREIDRSTLAMRDAVHHVEGIEKEAFLYEYLAERPALLQPEEADLRPQQYGLRFYLELAVGSITSKIKAVWQRVMNALRPGQEPTAAQIQSLYGTVGPELELDGDSTIDMLFNGLTPVQWLRGDEPGTMRTIIRWDGLDLDAERTGVILPSADLIVEQDGEGGWKIQQFWIQREQGGEREHFTPDSADYRRGLYLLNSAAVVEGEVVQHLAMGHVWTEQVAMAAFRHLNDSALGRLLRPHLRDVLEINRIGASDIFGESGVLNVSGLSSKGIVQALNTVLSSMDWATFAPRPKLGANDQLADQKAIFWDLLGEVVDQYIDSNMADLRDKWYQIRRMSDDLVSHSLPYSPWKGVEDHGAWADGSEVDNPGAPGRVPHPDGGFHAVRPITTSDQPTQDDIARLRQFCRYVLFIATFWHSSVHYRQACVTNGRWASLAPRGDGSGEFGGTSAKDLQHQLGIAHALLTFDGWQLLQNEHGDVQEIMLSAVESRVPELEAAGLNVAQILQAVSI